MTIPKTEAATYGRRGRAALSAQYTYIVEGERVTMLQIADRLGVHPNTARERMRKARKGPDSVSWLVLGLKPAE